MLVFAHTRIYQQMKLLINEKLNKDMDISYHHNNRIIYVKYQSQILTIIETRTKTNKKLISNK